MVELNGHTVKTWWICKKSDDSIIHYSFSEVGDKMESGQDELETFTVEQDWIDRLLELGITVE